MKTLMTHTILMLMVILTAITCEKGEQVTDIPNGIYQGTFTHLHLDATEATTDTVRIKIDGDEYQISGKNPLNFGYGEWEMEREQIRFKDQMLRNARHNWHWVLDGDYQLVVEKGKWHLVKEIENCRLYYTLTRQ
jgi:hypothetical protein